MKILLRIFFPFWQLTSTVCWFNIHKWLLLLLLLLLLLFYTNCFEEKCKMRALRPVSITIGYNHFSLFSSKVYHIFLVDAGYCYFPFKNTASHGAWGIKDSIAFVKLLNANYFSLECKIFTIFYCHVKTILNFIEMSLQK